MAKIIHVLSILTLSIIQCKNYRNYICFGLSDESTATTTPQSYEETNADKIDEQDLDHQILSNGRKLPLIGLSVGFGEDIEVTENTISKALSKETNLGYFLFDIANKKAERVVAEMISKIIKETHFNDITTIHIISKVSSNLNYKEAALSIAESIIVSLRPMRDNPLIDLHIHFLLEKYSQDENDTNPDKKHPWKESWNALEDMHKAHQPLVTSIGVSNFDNDDLIELINTQTMKPHFFRGNVLELEKVKDIMEKHRICAQVHQLFRLLSKPKSYFTYRGREVLRLISGQLSIDQFFSSSSIAISYFIKRSIGVISQTTHHIVDNSPMKAKLVPNFDSKVEESLRAMVTHLLEYLEPKNLKLVILNDLNNIFNLSWVDQSNENIFVGMVPKDAAFVIDTFPNHRFVVTDFESGKTVTSIQIDNKLGETKYVHLTASLLNSAKEEVVIAVEEEAIPVVEEEDSNRKIYLSLVNHLNSQVDVYWINNENKEGVLQGYIKSGGSSNLSANKGDEFVVTQRIDDKNQEILRFKASSGQNNVINIGKNKLLIKITMYNNYDFDLNVYWIEPDTKNESMMGTVKAGDSSDLKGSHGDEFVIRDVNGEEFKKITINYEIGEEQVVNLSPN